ncbi:TY-Chap domain-containing protein [Spirillospora sp. CA-294931]|uniref:TY-Chap domain-containing protein n=1 Tax=Spirillospora sp. CA-294931 TaxID=3240042 RepID=UPI003D912280
MLEWSEFARCLGRELAGLERDTILIVREREESRHYVQAMREPDRLYAEAVSNNFLDGPLLLTLADEEVMSEAGWRPPADPAPRNWWTELPSYATVDDHGRLADVMITALRDVQGVRRPSDLVYESFHRHGTGLIELLDFGIESADPARITKQRRSAPATEPLPRTATPTRDNHASHDQLPPPNAVPGPPSPPGGHAPGPDGQPNPVPPHSGPTPDGQPQPVPPSVGPPQPGSTPDAQRHAAPPTDGAPQAGPLPDGQTQPVPPTVSAPQSAALPDGQSQPVQPTVGPPQTGPLPEGQVRPVPPFDGTPQAGPAPDNQPQPVPPTVSAPQPGPTPDAQRHPAPPTEGAPQAGPLPDGQTQHVRPSVSGPQSGALSDGQTKTAPPSVGPPPDATPGGAPQAGTAPSGSPQPVLSGDGQARSELATGPLPADVRTRESGPLPHTQPTAVSEPASGPQMTAHGGPATESGGARPEAHASPSAASEGAGRVRRAAPPEGLMPAAAPVPLGPQDELEPRLAAARQRGDHNAYFDLLLTADLVLPGLDDPPTVTIGAITYQTVYTSALAMERATGRPPSGLRHTSFGQLTPGNADPSWQLAINPGLASEVHLDAAAVARLDEAQRAPEPLAAPHPGEPAPEPASKVEPPHGTRLWQWTGEGQESESAVPVAVYDTIGGVWAPVRADAIPSPGND